MNEGPAEHDKDYFADFFALLGVEPDLDASVLRRLSEHRFRERALDYHPDRNQDLSARQLAECVRRFRLHAEARRTLQDDDLRTRYLLTLEGTDLPISLDGVYAYGVEGARLIGELLPQDVKSTRTEQLGNVAIDCRVSDAYARHVRHDMETLGRTVDIYG